MQENSNAGILQPQNVQQSVIPQTNIQTMQQQVQPQTTTTTTSQSSNQQNTPSNSSLSTSDLTQEVETDKRGRAKKPIISYRYTVINGMGKRESGTFDAETENDVRNFFLSLNYQVLEVKVRSKLDVDISGGKFNASDLSFALTQLSTYLKAGIALADAVKILAKQSKKPAIRKSFYELVYQLLKGESLSEAMDMQSKVYPKLLINMVKTAEMTGDLPSILDDMAEYYTSIDQTRKQMKSAMTYPVIVLIIAIGVLVFMLVYLVPQFSALFESNGAELPALTLAVMGVSNFIQHNWIILLIGTLIFIFVFYELYTHVQKFRETIQVILMHFPIFKDIIIYNEVANFTKTFASLLNHGVFITDSMEILSKITSNEIYKKIIHKTLENLGKGDSISTAFKGEWAVPVVAYEMIVTGETTGQLGQMMEKVAAHFQSLHKNVINQMKSLVEPLLMCFLAVVVGIILLSIIQPMFSIYSQIK